MSDFDPEYLFATPFWSRIVVDCSSINENLLTLMARIEKENPAAQRSNVGGWHSQPNLHLNEDFSEIRQIVGTTCVQCATALNFDFEHFNLAFNEMWLNKNGPGDYNRAHTHPNAILSGVYYIKVPAASGNLELYDPIGARVMNSMPVKSALLRSAQTLEIESEEGKLLVFPSWLQHAVQSNRSNEERVSLSFNMIAQPIGPSS
jgi:uncharacterized protein (TIGR02466 family)